MGVCLTCVLSVVLCARVECVLCVKCVWCVCVKCGCVDVECVACFFLFPQQPMASFGVGSPVAPPLPHV